MKNLLSLILIFYALTRTCYAGTDNYPLTVSSGIIINAMAEPNADEIEQFINLTTKELILSENKSLPSLVTKRALYLNLSIIFSYDPDDIINIRTLDLEHLPADYFSNLIKNHTSMSANTNKAVTFKTILNTVKTCSNYSVIFVIMNKPLKNDTDIIRELLKKAAEKKVWISFQSVNNNFNNSKEHEEYKVMSLTLYLYISFDDTIHPGIKEKENTEVSTNFVFVYDVINATENYLANISSSMETYFQSRNEAPYKTISQYSIIFSSQPGTAITIEKSSRYSAVDFKSIISSELRKHEIIKSSLKGLLKALQTIPPRSWIVCYVNDDPQDKHETIVEIARLTMIKKIRITIHGYGGIHERLSLVYKMITDASWRASAGFSVRVNLVTSLIIFSSFIMAVKFV